MSKEKGKVDSLHIYQTIQGELEYLDLIMAKFKNTVGKGSYSQIEGQSTLINNSIERLLKLTIVDFEYSEQTEDTE